MAARSEDAAANPRVVVARFPLREFAAIVAVVLSTTGALTAGMQWAISNNVEPLFMELRSVQADIRVIQADIVELKAQGAEFRTEIGTLRAEVAENRAEVAENRRQIVDVTIREGAGLGAHSVVGSMGSPSGRQLRGRRRAEPPQLLR